jgi:hypothetical protein
VNMAHEARACRLGDACANRPSPGTVRGHEKDRRANADLSLCLVGLCCWSSEPPAGHRTDRRQPACS